MTEKEKMLAGELYNAADPILVKERHKARLLTQQINTLNEDSKKERNQILRTVIMAITLKPERMFFSTSTAAFWT